MNPLNPDQIGPPLRRLGDALPPAPFPLLAALLLAVLWFFGGVLPAVFTPLALLSALCIALRCRFFRVDLPPRGEPVLVLFCRAFFQILGLVILCNLAVRFLAFCFHFAIPAQAALDRWTAADSPLARLALAAAVFLAAPFLEETFFRGLLLPLLARVLPPVAALLLSALLFGILHGPALFPTMTAFALVLSLLRLRTATLLPCILLHTLWNALVLLLTLARLAAAPP